MAMGQMWANVSFIPLKITIKITTHAKMKENEIYNLEKKSTEKDP